MSSDSFISDKSDDICFDNPKEFQEKFDKHRFENLDIMVENDEILQKIESYK
jgi:zona occludens toxin (predicted ATPase)